MVFQAFQKNFAIVGINSNVAKQSYPFNVKILLGILLLGSAIVCNLLYVIYKAKTFAEYTQTIYICSVSCLILSALIITILKMKKLFEFIDYTDELANTSKSTITGNQLKNFSIIFFKILFVFRSSELKYSASQSIFHETNELVEKLSEIIFFVMSKMTSIAAIGPWCTYFFFMNFTTDLAFELPCPML